MLPACSVAPNTRSGWGFDWFVVAKRHVSPHFFWICGARAKMPTSVKLQTATTYHAVHARTSHAGTLPKVERCAVEQLHRYCPISSLSRAAYRDNNYIN
jgi:hypothetical protein